MFVVVRDRKTMGKKRGGEGLMGSEMNGGRMEKGGIYHPRYDDDVDAAFWRQVFMCIDGWR